MWRTPSDVDLFLATYGRLWPVFALALAWVVLTLVFLPRSIKTQGLRLILLFGAFVPLIVDLVCTGLFPAHRLNEPRPIFEVFNLSVPFLSAAIWLVLLVVLKGARTFIALFGAGVLFLTALAVFLNMFIIIDPAI